mmetsp:Transcript_3568/g.14859  ORF Transcript_3568/g.14859 Transcript_3568/m.14859 type:complete len:293 (-) Transcript_3568:1729-2607(-)
MSVRPCCLKMAFASTGSRAGSSVSPMSSIKSGLPRRMQDSSVRSMFGLLSLDDARRRRTSMRLIQRFACSWGSIISGQRSPRVTMMALSVDTASVGRPSICHWRTTTASPTVFMRVGASLQGMPCSLQPLTHPSSISSRYAPVKGPRYDTQPAAMRTSPTSAVICFSSRDTDSFQRTCSSASPVVSLPARTSRSSVSLASDSSRSFSASVSSACCCRAATLSCTSLRAACLPASSSCACATCALRAASLSFLGSTSLATMEYVFTACTHAHMGPAAPLLRVTSAVTMSGWSM